MNKSLLITCVVALLLFVSGTVFADTATITLHPGDNWVCAPLVPYDPSPSSIFSGIDIDENLTRFDPTTQSEVIYDESHPELFLGILLGEGYKVTNTTSSALTLSYAGVPDGVPDAEGKMTDMWISLAGNQYDDQDAGGMHWIGNPFNHAVSTDSCYVTDGLEMYTLANVAQAGWIDGLWTSLDGASQTMFTAGVSSCAPTEAFLRAGSMYEIVTHKDNLALIITPEGFVPDGQELSYLPVPEPASIIALLFGLAGFTVRRRK